LSELGFDIELFKSIASTFESNVRKEVRMRWNAWTIDLSKNEIHEVIGGLLSRQATLAIELVISPTLWTNHVAPLLLRSMGDAHINLVWIMKDPLARSRQFIQYGLGQMKLRIEHHRENIESGQAAPEEELMVEGMEGWLDSQRFSFLTEVNVGNWSEMNVREMAIEADVLDFYRFSYQPFSAAVHSSWNHISQFNLMHCESPLHRYHRVPAIADQGMIPTYPIVAAKYFNKSVCAFDEFSDVRVDTVDSYAELKKSLTAVFKEQEEETGHSDEV
jgi:hypothetical protein